MIEGKPSRSCLRWYEGAIRTEELQINLQQVVLIIILWSPSCAASPSTFDPNLKGLDPLHALQHHVLQCMGTQANDDWLPELKVLISLRLREGNMEDPLEGCV